MKNDLLDRTPFIELLDSIITKKIVDKQGFSFAIDGKWGCGKSFILKQLENSLNSKYLVIHYNCWENDYYEEPLVAILSVIVDKLNTVNPPSFSEQSRRRKEIAIKFLSSAAGMLVDHFTGINFTELSKAGADAIAADKEPVFSKSFDPNLPLKECIKIVQDQLSLLKIDWKGVVLVVDELDRCLPEYAIKVLERLHHICYCTDSDSYIFIQLMAINKDELASSILKVFNRQGSDKWKPYISFSTQRSETDGNIEGDLSGTIEDEDYRRKMDEFSNYYLQKFIQMVIPVPEDEKDLPMVPILNGFEKEFDAQKSIVPLSHVENFFNMVMIDFPIRIKEELVEKVKIIHQLTVEINSVKNKPSYGVLCVELMDVLFDGMLKRRIPFYECNEDCFWFELKDSSNVLCIKEYNRFSSALKKWSFSKMKKQSGNFYFKLDSPENYIKGFYVKGAFLCKGGYRKSEEEFVKKFRGMKERLV
jgi:hypothetical protein